MGQRVRIFGVDVDPLDHGDAVCRIIALANHAANALVVTANLDHVVRVRHDPRFRRVYQCAAIVAADGFPLVLASRLSGPRLPERVTGADLIKPICREQFDAGTRSSWSAPSSRSRPRRAGALPPNTPDFELAACTRRASISTSATRSAPRSLT